MKNTNSMFAFEKLDELNFPEEILPVYELLKSHHGRISFVKDHNGVPNVIFIATEEFYMENMESPYFSIFTKEKEDSTTYAEISHTPDEIYNNASEFLEKDDAELFVAIGFEESIITDEDYFEILYLMEDTKCNVIDAVVSLRRYPDWFNDIGEYPIYILQQEEILKEMAKKEQEYLRNKKSELLKKLNYVVDKNDEELFYKICDELKVIRKQLNELDKR